MTELASQQDVFANIRGWAPPELQTFLDQLLLLLPEEVQYNLKIVIDTLPPDGHNTYKVLEVVRSQWKGIQAPSRGRIAVVGPARTGKESLIAAISRKQTRRAASVFTVVDLQVLDEFLGYETHRSGPEELQNADVILLVLDARFELVDSTRQMYERLSGLNKPLLVVLNKIDQVEHPGTAIKLARKRLGARVLSVSVSQSETIDRLLKGVVATNPKTLYVLARNFPGFRRTLCDGIVSRAAFASGLVAAIPIPISDLLPITAIQTSMLLKIARAFGYPLNRQRARELLPMLVAAMVAREGSHRLGRHFPQYGKLIAVSIAGMWSFLLGQATIRYFDNVSGFLAGKDPEGFSWARYSR
ncbi:MAG: DUF697 domain-containing protein [Acidobacteriota bacterium]